MSTENTNTSNLRPLSRYITTHNPSGKAIFSTTLSESMPTAPIPDSAIFSLAYTTNNTPVDLSTDADITDYASYLQPGNAPGLVINSGSVCRIVDMQPGALSPMHRTVSIDFGVVLEGEVELVLDSGETRTLKRGDVAVQRGTNHAWRNCSSEGWARMLYVLQPAQQIEIGGRTLGEDLDGMGVRSST
ncbi:RmlC-like cupin domain-containing protein [Aspergillus unguis]